MSNNDYDSYNEVFNSAVQDFQEKKEKKEFTPKEYDEIKYCGLEVHKPIIGRIFGFPLNVPNRSDFDPVAVRWAEIYDDAGKKRVIKFPRKDENYILDEIYNLITKHTKVKKEGSDEYDNLYTYKDTHSDLFNRVTKNFVNGQGTKNPYEQGWKTRFNVVCNFLDNTDNWCNENKKLKILVDNVSYYKNDAGEDIAFYSKGITWTLYTQIMDFYDNIGSNFHSADIVIKKTQKPDDNKYIYGLYTPDTLKVKHPELLQKMSSDIKDMRLFEYEKNNLVTLYRPTSYSKIKKYFGKFIRKVDIDFGTRFMEKVEAIAEQERQLYQNNNTISPVNTNVSNQSNNTTPMSTTSSNTKKDDFSEFGNFESSNTDVNMSSSVNPPQEPAFNIALYYQKYPILQHIPENDRNAIIGYNLSNKSFKFIPDLTTGQCNNCKRDIPLNFKQCPYCGTYLGDDDIPF